MMSKRLLLMVRGQNQPGINQQQEFFSKHGAVVGVADAVPQQAQKAAEVVVVGIKKLGLRFQH